MAKLTTDELLDAFKELTLIELVGVRQGVRGDLRGHRRRARRRCRPGCRRCALPPKRSRRRTSFDVVLEAAGEKKIQVIKVVRELTSLGLGEAKAVVDGAPKAVLEGATKEAADKAKAALEEAGATVTLK